MDSTLSNGVPCRSIGGGGSCWSSFSHLLALYINYCILKLRLLGEEQFSIAATYIIPDHTVVALSGDTLI